MRQRRPSEIPTYVASGRERLAQLAAFVEGLAPEKLTFLRWYAHGRGCAVGLAAANDPWFQAQGLRLEHAGCLKSCRPVFAGASDWNAVAAFFEIGLAEARDLFDRVGYGDDPEPHPTRVAAKIRAHLATVRTLVAVD